MSSSTLASNHLHLHLQFWLKIIFILHYFILDFILKLIFVFFIFDFIYEFIFVIYDFIFIFFIFDFILIFLSLSSCSLNSFLSFSFLSSLYHLHLRFLLWLPLFAIFIYDFMFWSFDFILPFTFAFFHLCLLHRGLRLCLCHF